MKRRLTTVALRLVYVLFGAAGVALLVHEHRHGEAAETRALRQLSQASYRGDAADFDAALRALDRVSPERGALERARALHTGRGGTPTDAKRAEAMLETLARQDSEVGVRALAELGQALLEDPDTARSQRGLDLLIRAAALGERRAAAALGDFYAGGRGVPRDVTRAAGYYALAAESVPEAAMALSLMYADGRVPLPNSFAVTDRRTQALRLLEQDAQEGSMSSMVKLARYHERQIDFQPQTETQPERATGADEGEEIDSVDTVDTVADLSSAEVAAARHWYEQAVVAGSDTARVRLALLLRKYDPSPGGRQRSLSLLQQAADGGSGEALIALARGYRDGIGTPADPVKAFQAYRVAADRNLAGGLLAVGKAYMEGAGVEQDAATGLSWLRRAAELGSAGARYQIGVAYRNGTGVPQDDAEAVRWYRQAAEQGSTAGMAAYALALHRGRGIAPDPAEALVWADRAVSSGSRKPDLLTLVGRAYAQGSGVPQDIDKALRYLELAARQDDSDAMIVLGRLLALSRRAPPEVTIEWFHRAERSGNPNALAALGRAYASGFGVPLDPHKAFEYFHRASHLGSASALREVGHAYAIGFGVQQSPQVAIDWYLKAAALGDTKAMLALSFCHADGAGVPVSPAQALHWLRKAADAQDASAQYRLGVAYLTGNNLPRDPLQARRYLEASAARSFPPAKLALKTLLGAATPEPLRTASAQTQPSAEERTP